MFSREKDLAYPVDWCDTNNVCWAAKIKAQKNDFGPGLQTPADLGPHPLELCRQPVTESNKTNCCTSNITK